MNAKVTFDSIPDDVKEIIEKIRHNRWDVVMVKKMTDGAFTWFTAWLKWTDVIRVVVVSQFGGGFTSVNTVSFTAKDMDDIKVMLA